MERKTSTWHHGPMAAFDTETTGVDVDTDRIVTAAIWRIDPASGEKSCRTWMADPGIPIPEEAARIHGVSTEKARAQGRPASEVVSEIAAELADVVSSAMPIVAYNAVYDLTLLDRELTRYGEVLDFNGALRVIDPLVLDKRIDAYRKGSRRLADVCAHYQVPFEGQAHGSEADALAAARLAWRLGATQTELASMSVDDLHQAQRTWRAEQAASLEAYFRRTKDPDTVIERDWPIIPAAGL
ncbi:exonuclease domain-containing protein [Nocardiopsis rhodophaea]|uniref:exonuclease domain-containing protein n=1 Tax=Nocardiopsis rhodophaea TaxID=280238 RepID=UPI0031DBA09A